MLVINKYTCKKTGNTFIHAHDINVKNMTINKSFGKMGIDSISLFSSYKSVLLCEVVQSSQLSKVNFINVKWGFKMITLKNIRQVYLNGKKYTIAESYRLIDGNLYYSGDVTAKGWYKTAKGVLNNLTDEYTIK